MTINTATPELTTNTENTETKHLLLKIIGMIFPTYQAEVENALIKLQNKQILHPNERMRLMSLLRNYYTKDLNQNSWRLLSSETKEKYREARNFFVKKGQNTTLPDILHIRNLRNEIYREKNEKKQEKYNQHGMEILSDDLKKNLPQQAQESYNQAMNLETNPENITKVIEQKKKMKQWKHNLKLRFLLLKHLVHTRSASQRKQDESESGDNVSRKWQEREKIVDGLLASKKDIKLQYERDLHTFMTSESDENLKKLTSEDRELGRHWVVVDSTIDELDDKNTKTLNTQQLSNLKKCLRMAKDKTAGQPVTISESDWAKCRIHHIDLDVAICTEDKKMLKLGNIDTLRKITDPDHGKGFKESTNGIIHIFHGVNSENYSLQHNDIVGRGQPAWQPPSSAQHTIDRQPQNQTSSERPRRVLFTREQADRQKQERESKP